ncbi:MAG TPA: chemotaxis protein CheW [Treponemataceae bacterium]|nr:chemotaxis protein CheW [Treponemataceae bacterium]HPS43278.1 chemotaxis protein CheW [Treponemataceae bacterium]
MEESDIADIQEYLTFKLADETYAINVGCIKEVLGVPRITRVPRMPDYMTGVINLRGNVIPVIDLRLKFGMGATPVTEDTGIIVTELAGLFEDEAEEKIVMGIFSDSVEKVVSIGPSEIEAPPRIGMAIDTDFIAGMGRVDDSFVIILNIDKALSVNELTREKESAAIEA